MTRRIAVAFLLGAVAFVDAQVPARDAATSVTVPTGSGLLGGVVKDADDNALRRTAVTITGDMRLERIAVTDDAGRFAFPTLPAGRFTITAAKPGYPSMSYGASRPNRAGAGVMLKDGQQVTNILLTLARGAVLTGTVYDDRGQPMPGVPLNAWEVRTALSGERTLSWFSDGENGVTTDDRGAYRIYGLPPGEYTVGTSWFYSGLGGGDLRVPTDAEIRDAFLALTQGRAPGGAGTTPAPSPRPRYNYAPVFHPSSLDPMAATTYPLAAGEERTGVDLRMQFQPMSRLDGIVLSPEGVGTQARVSFSRRTPVPGSNSISVSFPGPDGRFSRASIGPGDYTILAEVAAAAGAPGLYALSEFSVSSADPVNVTLKLQPSMTMTGRLRFEGTGTPPPADLSSVYVYATTTGTAYPSTVTKTDAAGVFTITGLIPGQYRTSTTLPTASSASWMVRSVTVGGRDVTDLAVDLPPGEAPPAVVTLTDQISELSGTVTTTAGPATDYFVVVLPADRLYWPAGRRKASTRPDVNGHYIFRKLPPGEYRIAATTDLVPGDLNDNGALELLLPQSTPVTIAFGEKKVFDFRVGR
jgi:protocatechuate 3,4-dioxygenase beta subunit